VAGEVKIPTARNNLIGTQQTDCTIYLIASKQLGHLELHINITYTFVGQPSGVRLKNTFDLALPENIVLTVSLTWSQRFCIRLPLHAQVPQRAAIPGRQEIWAAFP